jgi:hypothetical protein
MEQFRATRPHARAVSDVEIVERCIYALVNEGARIIEDGDCAAQFRHRYRLSERIRFSRLSGRTHVLCGPNGFDRGRARLAAHRLVPGCGRGVLDAGTVCWRVSPWKAKHSPNSKDLPRDRSRHRFHGAYRPRQELERRIQYDLWRHSGRARRAACGGARRHRSGRSRGRDHGLDLRRGHHGRQHRSSDRASRRASRDDRRLEHQSLLQLGIAVHRARRPAHHDRGRIGHGRRRPREHFLRAERSQYAHAGRPWILEHKPTLYWSMLQTAETVAKRYHISKQAQDEYGVRSQLRAAAAQAAGKFNDEIVPMKTVMGVSTRRPARRHARGHHRSGRRHPSRHDARGRRQDPARDAGRRHHGGKRQPILRRQQRLCGHGRQARRTARARSLGYISRIRDRRLRTRRDGRGSDSCGPAAVETHRLHGPATSICGN